MCDRINLSVSRTKLRRNGTESGTGERASTRRYNAWRELDNDPRRPIVSLRASDPGFWIAHSAAVHGAARVIAILRKMR